MVVKKITDSIVMHKNERSLTAKISCPFLPLSVGQFQLNYTRYGEVPLPGGEYGVWMAAFLA